MKCCPYCGGQDLSVPTPILVLQPGERETLLNEGITVPNIQNCKKCLATLAPETYIKGSEAWLERSRAGA